MKRRRFAERYSTGRWAHTGVFATVDEFRQIRDLVTEATTADMQSSRFGSLIVDTARRRCAVRCHELARAHGLPEVRGYYGVSGNGEFLKPLPEKVR